MIKPQLYSIGIILISSFSANAALIDFATLANGSNGYGESAYQPFEDSFDGITVTVTGLVSGGSAYAYLDAGTGGLGVCSTLNAGATTGKQGTNSANLCNPGNDDNLTSSESLQFAFSDNVIVTNIWFNNNHDGGFNDTDLIDINGTEFRAITGLSGDSNAYGSFSVGTNELFTVGFVNQSYYVSAILFERDDIVQPSAAPAPGGLALLTLGLMSLGATRAGSSRRRKLLTGSQDSSH